MIVHFSGHARLNEKQWKMFWWYGCVICFANKCWPAFYKLIFILKKKRMNIFFFFLVNVLKKHITSQWHRICKMEKFLNEKEEKTSKFQTRFQIFVFRICKHMFYSWMKIRLCISILLPKCGSFVLCFIFIHFLSLNQTHILFFFIFIVMAKSNRERAHKLCQTFSQLHSC